MDIPSQQIYQSGQKSNHAHKLTREDGLRNREMGNQEQLRFSEYLSLQGKNHKCSLLNGTPDFEFHVNGTIKCVGAFKSLTLSVYGSAKQRWIALVDSDSAAEKACKETLEMALQLV
ncbi:MAG: hypothetical protein KGH81_07985 [Thaumarchaeota archaeon]|nr:hypothetical protein [Nitrososphaerota archaeon]